MSKRMGSNARKARKAAIEKRASLAPVLQVVDKRGCVVRVEGTFAGSSPMHHKAIQGRTYHTTAWNAPSGVGRGGSAKASHKARWSRD
jgi:hypothetical protein